MKLNELSLTVKLNVHFTLLLLTPLFLIIFISYFSFAKNIETNAKQTIDEFSAITVQNMDQAYNHLSGLVMEIVADKMLWDKMAQKDQASLDMEFEQWKRNRDIEQILTAYTSKLDGITNVGIVLLSGAVYSSNLRISRTLFEEPKEQLFASEWYRDFVSHDAVKRMYPLPNGNLLFVNRLNKMEQFNQPLGQVIFEIDTKMFDLMFNKTMHSDHISKYISNENNELLYANDTTLTTEILPHISEPESGGDIMIGNEQYWLQRKKSSLTGWSLMEMVPRRVIIRNANKLRNTSIVLVIVCYILSLLLTLLLTRNVVHPLRKIMTKMKFAERWGDDGALEVSGPAEVKDIAVRFNLMKQEIRQLIHDIREEQRRAKEADMAALEAQINPHFLYNTLNLIIFLSRKHRHEEIQTLTGSLISFLQNSLKSGPFFVPLTTELRMIEHYFLMHQYRTEGKIQLFMNVPHSLYHLKIPRFILQPVVENAIFHGLYPKQDTGTISISAMAEGNSRVVIKIIDDGVGRDPRAPLTARTRVGLNNVKERLKHLFPDHETVVTLYSKPGVGTTVTISFPAMLR